MLLQRNEKLTFEIDYTKTSDSDILIIRKIKSFDRLLQQDHQRKCTRCQDKHSATRNSRI